MLLERCKLSTVQPADVDVVVVVEQNAIRA